jgi:hypothetical protein
MNLKEEFKFALWEDAESGNEIEDKCEKIAEDFAIQFSTWISVNYYSIGEERWVSWKKDIDILSSKELLKIYKKEKNL